MENNSGKVWSEEHLEFVRANYNKMTKKELGFEIGRTESSVIDKGKFLGCGRKNINSRFNKETRICVICKNELPRTSEHFTTFISKRDKEVYQNKCRPCERIYVQEKNSTLHRTLKSILGGIKRSEKRMKKGFDLTLDFLLCLWEEQEGKCAITGIEMTHKKGKGTHFFSNLTIDRIDSNIGYIKENVQLACMWANVAKGACTTEEFKNMISITSNYLNK